MERKQENEQYKKRATSQQAQGKYIMYHVYIIQSLNFPNRFYTGYTENIKKRLQSHNHGQDAYTNKYKPWRIKTTITFNNRQRALDFERYLKSPSGQAFAKKRL